ncbi:redoxin domain-containing protein [Streptomyces sp. VNUA24]|uniref:redoxin domain-containing protein n=1 Tax=Streptomyces sp. VNUA24 TaxID=3031131 RepID=UPI0023B798BB|nr:redoxin domain-containing protein [Streptomyces sp. VNUA24]WEH12976.1 redoxin domain-containing protein [Streptomyces sp. VNUA24]
MTYPEKAPASVQGWFAAEGSADPAAGLRAVLAPDVVFDFGGRRTQGIDNVVMIVGLMMPAGWLGDVEWSLLPAVGDDRVTVRGVGSGGAPLPSPGGPMGAIDFTFTLGADGLITEIAPQPHHPEPDDLVQPLRPGDIAPDFALPDVDGAEVSLRQEGVRATVVVFTCNHCPFSLGWHNRVQQAAGDYAARGVRFLHINPNDPAVNPKDGVEHSRKRVADGEFPGPYLVDEDQAVARRWGARHTPEVFVLDELGTVVYHGAPDADVGDESLNAGWLRGALDHVLAGTVPDPADTDPVGCSIKWTR